MNTADIAVISELVSEANHAQMAELAEFQLALVGGGVGEVVLS